MKTKRMSRTTVAVFVSLLCAAVVAGTALGAKGLPDVFAVLSEPGTINSSENPVHWTKLKGVPAGVADGLDNGVDRAGFGLRKNIFPDVEFAVDLGKIQRRVSAACTAGEAVQSIGEDGSVACGGAAPVVYQGWNKPDSLTEPIGDDWGSLGGVLDIPAGRWLVTAVASIYGGGNYDIEDVHCQLATWQGTSRVPLDDRALTVGAPDGLADSPAYVTFDFAGVLDATEAKQIGVMCRDRGSDAMWTAIKILATQASELHVLRMH